MSLAYRASDMRVGVLLSKSMPHITHRALHMFTVSSRKYFGNRSSVSASNPSLAST